MRLMTSVVWIALCGAVLGVAACGDGGGNGGDAGTDSGTDTDVDTDADADAGADAGAEVDVLTDNPDPCETLGAIGPAPGEEGQWAAVRLVAPVDVRLDTIRYVLMQQAGELNCRVDIAHEFALFAGDGSTIPPQEPEELMRVDVAPEPLEIDGPLEISLEAAAPFELAAGEEVFLAISMEGAYPDVLCWQICFDDMTPNGSWWGAATEPPYPWATLESYAISGDIMGEIDVTPL